MITKYSITRALSEVKLLDARIEKKISTFSPVAVKRGDKLRSPNSQYKPEDFEKKAISDTESIDGLISRLTLICNLIDKSNHSTKVKVWGKDVTISEVLVIKKHTIPLYQNKLDRIQNSYIMAKRELNAALSENEAMKENQLKALGSSDGKSDTSFISSVVNQIEATWGVKLVGVPDVNNVIEDLSKYIDDFTNNIDYVLSESNSNTFIYITDEGTESNKEEFEKQENEKES